ncbi:MAG: M20/M25/M40 family metallo-hydrolase [Cytophagaceae bacterium]|nr:M20/M25/M40 family metallo-hydrolase [Cytophagaceae bacterium]
MKKSFCCAFLLLTLGFQSHCFSQNMERVKTVIATLSSKQLHGRSPAFEGDRKASTYIESLFRDASLQPVGQSFLQHFSYDTQIFPKKMSLTINGKKLQPGVDFIIDPVSASGKGKAEILYLDSTHFLKTNNRVIPDCKNKAVVFDQKYYARLNELPLEVIQNIYSAACIIEYNHSKLTMSIASKPLSVPFFKLGTVDITSLKSGKCSFQLTSEWKKNYQSQNIVGMIKGSIQPDSFIVFSAHYDHLGHLGKKTYFPGANDNASGISMLNELAHYYSDSLHKPAYSILFIAFGAEEAGLIGSNYFTQHPTVSLKQIKFLLNMDIVGTGDESITVVNGTEYPIQFNRLDSLNKVNRLFPAVVKRGKAANSDHYFFTQKGVPAFFIYTNGKQKAYHDVFDKAETLPLSKYKELFTLFTLFAKTL